MVRLISRDGSEDVDGMDKLRMMVLARAFPELDEEERLSRITKIFDTSETLDRLCCISGGHIRYLLRILNTAIAKQMTLPISRSCLESAILDYSNSLIKSIDRNEWQLLQQVNINKVVDADPQYQNLIRSLFIYEYSDKSGSWFEVNPLIKESENFQAINS